MSKPEYVITIHRRDGSIKTKTVPGESNAYAWVRMTSNRKWRAAYVSPADKSHDTRQVFDSEWTPARNARAMGTPPLAKT